MVKMLFAALLLFSTAANALEVSKPAGGVEVFLPNYGVTISVVAISMSSVGAGLAVLEKKPNGAWDLCGTCLPAPQNIAAEIAFHGGIPQWIESQRGPINDVLARRYPPLEAPTGPVQPAPGASVIDLVNYALATQYKMSGAKLEPK